MEKHPCGEGGASAQTVKGRVLSRMLLSTEVVMVAKRQKNFYFRGFLFASLILVAAVTLSQAQTPAQTPAQPQQPDQATPDAGGPGADSGVIVLPKKKDVPDEAPTLAPAAPRIKNPEGTPNFSLRIEVPEVTVDVGVLLEKTHQFVPNLKPGNFRVYERRRWRGSSE
jgi:hypothetical protein